MYTILTTHISTAYPENSQCTFIFLDIAPTELPTVEPPTATDDYHHRQGIRVEKKFRLVSNKLIHRPRLKIRTHGNQITDLPGLFFVLFPLNCHFHSHSQITLYSTNFHLILDTLAWVINSFRRTATSSRKGNQQQIGSSHQLARVNRFPTAIRPTKTRIFWHYPQLYIGHFGRYTLFSVITSTTVRTTSPHTQSDGMGRRRCRGYQWK